MPYRKKAFTLIELLVVVAIIGILASIIVISYTNAQARARDNRRKADIHAIASAIDMYYIDHKVYPYASGDAQGYYRVRSVNSVGTTEQHWSMGFDGLLTGYISTPLSEDPKNIDKGGDHTTWRANPVNDAEYSYTYLSTKYSYVMAARLEVQDDGNGDRFENKQLKKLDGTAALLPPTETLTGFTVDNKNLYFVGANLLNQQ